MFSVVEDGIVFLYVGGVVFYLVVGNDVFGKI